MECVKCAPAQPQFDIHDRYTSVVKTLGRGAFGSVVLVENEKTGETAAIKKSSNEDGFSSDFIREISSLRALEGHPNIVKMIGYNVRVSGTIIALEPAITSLAGALNRSLNGQGGDTEIVKQVMFQIINAMYYMNGRGIWHRDLKPQNVLIFPNGVVKITDFGLSQGGPFQWISTANVMYTLAYRAPEILLAEIYKRNDLRSDPSVYDEAAEVFSVGATMWDVLCGSDQKTSSYLKGKDVPLQLLAFIRALGIQNFELCPFELPMCSFEYFVYAYARSRQINSDAANASSSSSSTKAYEDEIESLPQTKEMAFVGVELSNECSSLMKGLLFPNPKKRITMKDALNHPYFDSVRSQYTVIEPPSHFDTSLILCETPSNGVANDVLWTTFTKWMISDWKINKQARYTMPPAVFSLALQIFRCFLQRQKTTQNITSGYAFACLYLADIYTEDFSIKYFEFINVLDHVFSNKDIQKLAINVFITVGALLHLPTPFVLLAQKIKDAHIQKTTEEIMPHAKKLLQLQTSIEAYHNQLSDEEIATIVFNEIISPPPPPSIATKHQTKIADTVPNPKLSTRIKSFFARKKIKN